MPMRGCLPCDAKIPPLFPNGSPVYAPNGRHTHSIVSQEGRSLKRGGRLGLEKGALGRLVGADDDLACPAVVIHDAVLQKRATKNEGVWKA